MGFNSGFKGLKHHRTTWTMGPNLPVIGNQAYGFSPFTTFQAFRRYTQHLCRYKFTLSRPVMLHGSRKITSKHASVIQVILINGAVHCYMALYVSWKSKHVAM